MATLDLWVSVSDSPPVSTLLSDLWHITFSRFKERSTSRLLPLSAFLNHNLHLKVKRSCLQLLFNPLSRLWSCVPSLSMVSLSHSSPSVDESTRYHVPGQDTIRLVVIPDFPSGRTRLVKLYLARISLLIVILRRAKPLVPSASLMTRRQSLVFQAGGRARPFMEKALRMPKRTVRPPVARIKLKTIRMPI